MDTKKISELDVSATTATDARLVGLKSPTGTPASVTYTVSGLADRIEAFKAATARPPSAHASTHAAGQPDALTPSSIGALSSAPRGPTLVVGNSAAGDTLAVCDYLDTGNGAQLLAATVALNAAGGGVLVLRPGVYDCPVLPIETTLVIRGERNDFSLYSFVGADPALVVLRVRDARNVLNSTYIPGPTPVIGILTVENLVLEVLDVTTLATGDRVVYALAGAVRNVVVKLPSATNITTESIRYVVSATIIERCTVVGSYANGTAGGLDVTAFSGSDITYCTAQGVDVGSRTGSGSTSLARILHNDFSTTARGIVVQSLQHVFVSGNRVYCSDGDAVGEIRCIEVNSPYTCTITNNELAKNNGSLSYGIYLTSSTVMPAPVVVGNKAQSFDHDCYLTSYVSDAMVKSNLFDTITDNGTNTDKDALPVVGLMSYSATDYLLGPADLYQLDGGAWTLPFMVRFHAVPAGGTEIIIANWNAFQFEGGWYVGYDGTRWKFGVGQVSDGDVIDNNTSGPYELLQPYLAQGLLGRLIPGVVTYGGGTAKLYIRENVVATLTPASGYDPTHTPCAMTIGRGTNAGAPMVNVSSSFVGAGYIEGVTWTDAQVAAWAASCLQKEAFDAQAIVDAVGVAWVPSGNTVNDYQYNTPVFTVVGTGPTVERVKPRF